MNEPRYNKYLIIVTIILALLVLNTVRSILDKKNSLKRIDNAKEELAILKNENENLKNDINYANSDEYLEKAALEQLNMTKPGYSILVMEGEPTHEQQEIKEIEQATIKENWTLWVEVFNLPTDL